MLGNGLECTLWETIKRKLLPVNAESSEGKTMKRIEKERDFFCQSPKSALTLCTEPFLVSPTFIGLNRCTLRLRSRCEYLIFEPFQAASQEHYRIVRFFPSLILLFLYYFFGLPSFHSSLTASWCKGSDTCSYLQGLSCPSCFFCHHQPTPIFFSCFVFILLSKSRRSVYIIDLCIKQVGRNGQ